MANINQISLKVCGNPDANGGFQPMVIFNSPSIEIKDNFIQVLTQTPISSL